MDIKKLKEVINSNLPDDYIEAKIINILSKDENVIPMMLSVLQNEREIKKEISMEMNVLLSKAHIGLDNKKFNKGNFMQNEIIEFYTKYKDHIGHCFKNLKL